MQVCLWNLKFGGQTLFTICLKGQFAYLREIFEFQAHQRLVLRAHKMPIL